MERLRRRSQEELPHQPPPAVVFEPPAREEVPVSPTTVQVIWGPIAEHMAVGGMTIAEVRVLLQRPYNIPPQAAALVNGRPVTSAHRLAAGDVLEFARASGEKGGGA